MAKSLLLLVLLIYALSFSPSEGRHMPDTTTHFAYEVRDSQLSHYAGLRRMPMVAKTTKEAADYSVVSTIK